MVHVYGTFIYMLNTDVWDIHIEHTFMYIQMEYLKYLNFRSPCLFCTHVAPWICCYYFALHMYWNLYVEFTIKFMVNHVVKFVSRCIITFTYVHQGFHVISISVTLM
jgi:hypothetical protein